MFIGVPEAARRMQLSEQRVRQLLASHQLVGSQVGGRWLIEPAALRRSKPLHRRPMSDRMIWALLNGVDSPQHNALDYTERNRLRAKRLQLANSEHPASMLRSWARNRAMVSKWNAHPNDVHDLMSDSRVRLSGVSDPMSGISAPGEVEGYVRPSDIHQLSKEFLLVESPDRGNVLLRICDLVFAERSGAPRLVVAADLADRDLPRVNLAAQRLIHEEVNS